MALTLKTPGVYIQEKNAFPSSIVQVATAVPAFIGYTEKAERGGKSLLQKPTRISSLAEYVQYFGGAFRARFTVVESDANDGDAFILNGNYYKVTRADNNTALFFNSVRLFFENGGGTCYIVSTGTYAGATTLSPAKSDFDTALNSLIKEYEPTLIAAPEAVLLEEADCYSFYQAMIAHCAKLQSRMAILDVYNGTLGRTYDEADVIDRFRSGIGQNSLNYATAYYPFVETTVVQANELDYRNFDGLEVLEKTLVESVAKELLGDLKAVDATDEDRKVMLNQALVATSPTFKSLLAEVRRQLNVLPPSAAMAGVFAMVDSTRGVWKAPANVSLSSVVAPSVGLNNDEQEDLNVDGRTGKSINVIRSFPGAGVIVWGARTLDGNSQDWRYLNVRRTLIMIEQSTKNAAKTYVFEPNDGGTWFAVRSMIENYLNGLWKEGALVGVAPSDAYQVSIGLGSTMTPNDVLEGIMRITVKVAISRPAEFIVITFQQKVQESAAAAE
jgi:phage tail sheath protein FI